ncbi:MAG: DUF771 domain-containing protein [Lentilactobacillus diolivorans]|jgi:phage pi2 protein 07|nr:DUF771 domain-containing protein [Lentilactobacillus diolivorans]
MTQQTLTVNVPVPEGFVIVKQSDLDQTVQESLTIAWNMTDLRNALKRKTPAWIKNHILDCPKYHADMERLKKERAVIEPRGQGGRWYFKPAVMAEWISEHWEELPWEVGE